MFFQEKGVKMIIVRTAEKRELPEGGKDGHVL